MNLKDRIGLMVSLGTYLKSEDIEWKEAKSEAFIKNGWFTEEFIDLAVDNIITYFLDKEKLECWINYYHLDDNIQPKNIGIVMAGNIPLVGFHDFLSVFISGHRQVIKMSSKDNILLKKIYDYLILQNREVEAYVKFAERLNGCDAYLTTGSNNTSRYFEYYFGKYSSIIRSQKTSAAILKGDETMTDLEKLADDICLFFGLGCRNVTKLFVPENYNFEKLLAAFSKFEYFTNHKKYRNNFDYYMTLQVMNGGFYMTNQVILLIENDKMFSPISQVGYEFYNENEGREKLENAIDLQCIVGNNHLPFGTSQQPGLFDYADNIDTMAFLLAL